MELVRGQNTPITLDVIDIAITGAPEERIGSETTPFAVPLGADGKLAPATRVITPWAGGGTGVKFELTTGTFRFTFAEVPAAIDKVLIGLAIDAAAGRTTTFRNYQRVGIAAAAPGSADVTAGFQMTEFEAGESALILVEVYRRQGQWKMRAVGQGYAQGWSALASAHGADPGALSAPG